MVVDAARSGRMPNPAKVLADFRSRKAARTSSPRASAGELKSAFPAARRTWPRTRSGRTTSRHTTRRPRAPANIVVVDDTDILADRFWVRVQDFFGQQIATPFSDNGAFVANLVGTLAGGDALIGLRSRGESLRPFELVEDIRRNADAAVPPDRTPAHPEAGRDRAEAARAAPGHACRPRR